MKYDIVIGLPSYNEEDSIAHVTRTVDRGLRKHFPNYRALIINGDSASTDRTVEVFRNIATDITKEIIIADRKGKGVNVFNILNRAREYEAKAIAFFDTDVASIGDDWVKKMLGPVFDGCGFVAPYFLRSLHDGTITNQFAYPLFRALYGADIRQPIGGEAALSGTAVDAILESSCPPEVERFGIDIFMAAVVLSAGYKVGQGSLGAKTHKPSLFKLEEMFFQVADTFFKVAKMHKKFIARVNAVQEIYREEPDVLPPVVSADEEYLAQRAAGAGRLDSEKWFELIVENFGDARKLTPYFFQRILTFFSEIEGLGHKDGEKLVRRQAEMFFEKRNDLVQKI